MFQNFIFDIDGTIVDTEEIVIRCVQRALLDEGITYPREDLKFLFGIPGEVAMQQFGVKDGPAFLQRWEGYEQEAMLGAPMFDGLDNILSTLKASGKRLGVVTSRIRVSCENSFLCRFESTNFFDASVCCDEVIKPKPYADSLLKCLDLIGVQDADSVFIGDSIYDMQCANNAGVAFALALWGSKTTEGYDRVDYILKTPADILTLT